MTKDTEKEPVKTLRMKHDEFVRVYMSEKETAISFFRNYLPAEITEHMDFKSLSMPKDSFLNKKMARYYSDILYEVRLKGAQAFIYLLIEHKSKKDTFVGFQLLKYCVRIWESYLKQNKNAKKLPVILPIVIYHGETEWGVNTEFISLVDVPENLMKSVREYIPNFKYNLQDISHKSDNEIKGVVLLRILLLTMKYIFKPEFQEKIKEIFGLFRKLKNKERGIEYVEVFLEYLSHQLPNDWIDVVDAEIPHWIEEGGTKMISIAESWMRKGKRKGKLEGKREGKLEGKKETIWEVIKNAFNMGLPINAIEKLTGLPAEDINKMREKMA
jgi:predicted transposase/invertase (TIGR01784 family)